MYVGLPKNSLGIDSYNKHKGLSPYSLEYKKGFIKCNFYP